MDRQTLSQAARLGTLALLCSSACATGGGGGSPYASTPSGSGGAADSACNPLVQVEGCYGNSQMLCDNASGTWQLLGVCEATTVCGENGLGEQPGAFVTVCQTPPSPAAADATGGQDVVGGGGGGGDTVGGGGTGGPGPTTAEAVCARWKQDRSDLAEGTFSGNMAACDPGDVSESAKNNALKLVNLYRWLVGLPEVARAPDLDQKAQACALIMAANGKLSHTPAQSWKCWTEDGSLAAKRSNISTAPGVTSVDRYMVDSGAHNHDTLGHRRWILSHSLGPIGVGSTATKASCLWVIGGTGKSQAPFIAWPPAGKVPVKAFGPYGKESIDGTGWSIQSDSIVMTKAKVRILDESGAELPMTQWQLGGGYGSKYALGFAPSGWKAEGGKTYTVEISGVAKPFSYQVEVLTCD